MGRAEGWGRGVGSSQGGKLAWAAAALPQPTRTWGLLCRPPVPPARHPHPALLLPALPADLGEGRGSCRLGVGLARGASCPSLGGCALSCSPASGCWAAKCHLWGQLAPSRGAGEQAAGLSSLSFPAKFLFEA